MAQNDTIGMLNNTNQGHFKRSKVCENCQATSTTQWRTGEDRTLCNKCGLYFARNQKHRPLPSENPMSTSTHATTIGKVSNVRRKQLEIGLQHSAKRQKEAELYFRHLAEAHPLNPSQFPGVAHLMTMPQLMADFSSPMPSHQSQSYPNLDPHIATLPPQPTQCTVMQQIQNHLDQAHELLSQLQHDCQMQTPSQPLPFDPSRPPSPNPLSNVLQKQLDIQLQHCPARQTTEVEWHRRAATVSQLPLAAYLPYIGGDACATQPLSFADWESASESSMPDAYPPPTLSAAGTQAIIEPDSELLKLMRNGLTTRNFQKLSSHLQSSTSSSTQSGKISPQRQELEATARQNLARKNRQLFEAASQNSLSPPRNKPSPTAKSKQPQPQPQPTTTPTLECKAEPDNIPVDITIAEQLSNDCANVFSLESPWDVSSPMNMLLDVDMQLTSKGMDFWAIQ